MVKIKKNKNSGSFYFRMRPFFSQGFLGVPGVRWILLATLIFNLAGWATLLVFFYFFSEPSFLILHYNVYFGVDLIGEWWQFFTIPGLALFFSVLNVFLGWVLHAQKEIVAVYILLLATFLIQVGTLVSIVGFILINY